MILCQWCLDISVSPGNRWTTRFPNENLVRMHNRSNKHRSLFCLTSYQWVSQHTKKHWQACRSVVNFTQIKALPHYLMAIWFGIAIQLASIPEIFELHSYDSLNLPDTFCCRTDMAVAFLVEYEHEFDYQICWIVRHSWWSRKVFLGSYLEQ